MPHIFDNDIKSKQHWLWVVLSENRRNLREKVARDRSQGHEPVATQKGEDIQGEAELEPLRDQEATLKRSQWEHSDREF